VVTVKPLVFLDFDGVVMTNASYEGRSDRSSLRAHVESRLDRGCVGWVSQLCVEVGAELVISSSWRGTTLEDQLQIEQALWNCGLDGRVPVVGQTPFHYGSQTGGLWKPSPRGGEIRAWLDARRPGWELQAVLVLDDNDPVELHDRWVRSRMAGGFGERQLRRARELLGLA
jgi:hypothetical protein